MATSLRGFTSMWVTYRLLGAVERDHRDVSSIPKRVIAAELSPVEQRRPG